MSVYGYINSLIALILWCSKEVPDANLERRWLVDFLLRKLGLIFYIIKKIILKCIIFS